MKNKEVNFGNVRTTDSRNKKRIHVAKPRNVGEEAEIEIRKNAWKKQHSEFIERNLGGEQLILVTAETLMG